MYENVYICAFLILGRCILISKIFVGEGIYLGAPKIAKTLSRECGSHTQRTSRRHVAGQRKWRDDK